MADKVRQNAKTTTRAGDYGVINFGDYAEKKLDKAGTFRLDIVPYIVQENHHPDGVAAGDLWYKRPYWTHRNVGVDAKTVVCLKSIGKPCPICKQYARIKSQLDVTKEEADLLKPSARVLYNVMEKDGSIALFDMSDYLFQRILDEEINEGEESYASFAELEGGSSLKVRVAESKFGTNKFYEASRIDFVPRNDLDEDVLEQTAELGKRLKLLSYEQLEAMLMGEDTPDEEEEEQEVSRKPVAKAPAKKQQEEETEDEFEEGFEEEEEPAPKKKPVAPASKPAAKPAQKKPAPKQEETEDDFGDFEEEEPAPKKPVAKAPAKKPAPAEEEDFGDFEEGFEEEEEAPAPKKPAAPAKKPAPPAKAPAKKQPKIEEDDDFGDFEDTETEVSDDEFFDGEEEDF